jgi:hypothetical protein
MIIKSRRENDERYFYGLLIDKELPQGSSFSFAKIKK